MAAATRTRYTNGKIWTADPDRPHTCEELAAAAGLSVVTVRRYLTHLAQQGQVTGDMDYGTGGRPCLVYRLAR